MEDARIIELYFERNETAIDETAQKYGAFCHRIALNILSLKEDAEECVNDTYHAVWNKIPPELPRSFRAFLGRITRNLSISRFRANRAQKRYHGLEILLSELDDCIPDVNHVEHALDRAHLATILSDWLDTLTTDDRVLFLRRYWFGDDTASLSAAANCTSSQVANRLFQLRKKLKSELEAKGVTL